jgi:hypothetical protein
MAVQTNQACKAQNYLTDGKCEEWGNLSSLSFAISVSAQLLFFQTTEEYFRNTIPATSLIQSG